MELGVHRDSQLQVPTPYYVHKYTPWEKSINFIKHIRLINKEQLSWFSFRGVRK